LVQLTARQKSRTNVRRAGGWSEVERALKRAKTCTLIKRPEIRTTSNNVQTNLSVER
jgi:hypothetical protein